MLKVDHARWNQTADDLRELALEAPHLRTRERGLALYEIARGSNATTVAGETGRNHQTVMRWVHDYNEHGPKALSYRRTGGRPPLRGGRGRPRRGDPGRRRSGGR